MNRPTCNECGAELVEVDLEGGRCRKGHWTPRASFGCLNGSTDPMASGKSWPWSTGAAGAALDAAPGPYLVIQSLVDVVAKPITWIWPRWLAKGKLHILGGVGGIGKGTIMAELAAQLSTGRGTLPDGTPAQLVKTLFVLSEDAPDDTLKPRLAIHGADMQAISHVAAVRYPDRGDGMLSLKEHVSLLESEVIGHGFGLVVFDALSDFLTGADRNSEGDVRDLLMPVGQMAQRTDVAIVGVMHPGKGNAELKAFQRLLGASAFGNIARCVWLAAESPDGEGRNLLGVDKSNLAMKPQTLEWSRREDEPIAWHGPSTHVIGDVFGASSAKPRDDAEGFLRELLAGGSVAVSRVTSMAKVVGLSWGTVRRAAEALRVEKYRPPGQKNPPWFWKLPIAPANDDPPTGVQAEEDRAQLEQMDDLLTPRDTQVSNSLSRREPVRLAHDDDACATREKPQNDGKMFTSSITEQVVPGRADDLLTSGRLDELLTGETKGVSNSSIDRGKEAADG